MLDGFPGWLLEPPGLWALGLLVVALCLWMLRAGIELVMKIVGGGLPTKLGREVDDLLHAGDTREAGRAFEALGKTQKALKLFRQGDWHEDRALLLLRLGRRDEAKSVARDGGEWRLYGELCQEDGELEDAGVAFERAGQAYLAGQCYAETGQAIDAARCYLAAGMEAEVVLQLKDATGDEAADLLDQAVRSSLEQMGSSGLSLELQEAVQRCVQLWISQGRTEKAFRLAVDSDRLKLAVPVARDYLDPSLDAASVCIRAGAHRVAADIYGRLGETRLEALQRAEDALRRDRRSEAAEWFEKAEEWAEAADHWAAAGNTERAAELFAKAGDVISAAQLTVPTEMTGAGFGSVDADPRLEQPWLTRAHVDGLQTELAIAVPRAGGPVDPHRATVPSFGDFGEAQVTAVVSSRPGIRSAPPPLSQGWPEDIASGSRYELLEELGRGGMGLVYLAEDRVLQRKVAFKVVPENVLSLEIEPESILAEARAAARLSHPNIVQIYDAGRKGKGFYVVMELVRGESLEQILAGKQITMDGALRIGLQICAALDHAHNRHIIHRDLKPSNLMWSDERILKLTDFGLARAFEASQGRVATQSAGTPSYMAPEQIRGEPVSPLVDIYSFGCVLFELLCRESVFGTGPPSFHHHLSSVPRDPRQLRSDMPGELAGLILRCLAKNPSDRPQSAAELGKALAEMLKAA